MTWIFSAEKSVNQSDLVAHHCSPIANLVSFMAHNLLFLTIVSRSDVSGHDMVYKLSSRLGWGKTQNVTVTNMTRDLYSLIELERASEFNDYPGSWPSLGNIFAWGRSTNSKTSAENNRRVPRKEETVPPKPSPTIPNTTPSYFC